MADPVDQLKQQSGTPYQYLTRLELLNRWCSGPTVTGGMALTRLEGFARVAGRFSIITSQPFFNGTAIWMTPACRTGFVDWAFKVSPQASGMIQT